MRRSSFCKTYLLFTIFIIFAFNSCSLALTQQTIPNNVGINGVVLGTDNKPAPGATVTYSLTENPSRNKGVEIGLSTVTDSNGRFHLPLDLSADSANPYDVSRFYDRLQISAETKDAFGIWQKRTKKVQTFYNDNIEICLSPTYDQRVKVTLDGKPAAHIKIGISMLSYEYISSSGSAGLSISYMNDINNAKRWVAETDDNGESTIKNVPLNHLVIFDILDSQYALVRDSSHYHLKEDITNLVITRFGSMEAKLIVPEKLSVPIRCAYKMACEYDISDYTSDDKGRLSVNRLKPGDYKLSIYPAADLAKDWIVKPIEGIRITAGKVTEIKMPMEHGYVISGTVVSKENHQPIPGVTIKVGSEDGDYDNTVVTDAKGFYKMRVFNNKYVIKLELYNSIKTYRVVIDNRDRTVDLEVNENALNAPVTGIVLDENDNPVADARLYAYNKIDDITNRHDSSITTDATGHFEYRIGSNVPYVYLIAGKSNDVIEKPCAVYRGDNVVLKLKHNSLIRVNGFVRDDSGYPCANVMVTLKLSILRDNLVQLTCITDKTGYYHFNNVFPGAKYEFVCNGGEFANYSSGSKHIKPGANESYDITLSRSNSFAAGKLVDVSNEPVRCVYITCLETRAQTRTDNNGMFRIEGVPAGKIHLYAGRYIGDAEAIGGKIDNIAVAKYHTPNQIKEHFAHLINLINDINCKGYEERRRLGYTPSYNELIAKANANARKRGVNVLVVFHTPSSYFCSLLYLYLNDPAIKQIIEKRYELVMLRVADTRNKDLENPGVADKMVSYGGVPFITDKTFPHYGETDILPYFAVADSDGNILANSNDIFGEPIYYPKSDEKKDVFINMLRKGASLTDSEIATLRKGLDNIVY